MAKRTGLMAAIAGMERDLARAEAASKRARAADEQEWKRTYDESRQFEVEALNDDLIRQVSTLEGLLAATLRIDHRLRFESLKQPAALADFDPGALGVVEPPPDPADFPRPRRAGRFFRGAKERLAAAEAEADSRFQAALAAHSAREEDRQRRLSLAAAAHERRNAVLLAQVEEQHRAVDSFGKAFEAGDPDAIATYFGLVLRAAGTEDFPLKARIAYVPEQRDLVVEVDLPAVAVVPTVKSFRYVKATDTIASPARPASQVKSLYSGAIAQLALRTIYQLFETDRPGHLAAVVVSGFVDTVDPATGKPFRPCLLTVRTTRAAFEELDLSQIDPLACLSRLEARLSRSPVEASPVEPLVSFPTEHNLSIEEIILDQEDDDAVNLEPVSPLGEWLALEARHWGTDTLDGDPLTGCGYALRDLNEEPVSYDDPRLEACGCLVARVAGVSYRMDALQLPVFDPGQRLVLVRDRDNPHDADAIPVFDLAMEHQVGFLPRDVAAGMASRLDAGEQLGALSLWEWRDEQDRRVALRILLGPIQQIEEMVLSAQAETI